MEKNYEEDNDEGRYDKEEDNDEPGKQYMKLIQAKKKKINLMVAMMTVQNPKNKLCVAKPSLSHKKLKNIENRKKYRERRVSDCDGTKKKMLKGDEGPKSHV
ncbi:hypothetical protein DAPPUDRAFT_337635 [Daphnia pulex]|uniref:Uncharacterized protein n=1 Tax=Daphnia pulex TaxID=6669 RepID=E9I1X8_DAPPU|nr:hypothetical protein DAPPUDRAFT_337635 [Daphnia pulex]|eukprot:EFX62002.1 hypothetical protein DAPPUDRAFT_337635 [Daphnia pulex]